MTTPDPFAAGLRHARVLVVTAEGNRFAGLLADRFPDLDLHFCSGHGELQDALERLSPNIVFSFKETGQQPCALQPAFDCTSVEWLHIGTYGTDHLPALTDARIKVSNNGKPGAGGHPPMAEAVVTAMLAVNFGLPDYQRQQQRHEWRILPWRPVRGQTLLAIGVGRIGGEIARLAAAHGMRVIGLNASGRPVEHVDEMRTPADLHHSLAEADFVSLQLPLTAETSRLIDAAALAQMKAHAWLINVGRGPLIDEIALVEALRAKRIGGAILDVFEQEPLPEGSPLWDLENCIITPHSAGWTSDWQAGSFRMFADNLDDWLQGRAPRNLLN